MATYLAAPRARLSFGDVCSAPFFHDVYVSEKAHRLVTKEASAAYAQKQGWGNKPIPLFVATDDAPDGFVLADGSHRRLSICLTDDCAIETAFGRGEREAKGRLLFAPLVQPATEKELDDLRERPSYGRFVLEPDSFVEELWIVNLRNCFMVDAAALTAPLERFVERSTADDVRAKLADQWAAYATRRGPIVIEDNSEKLAGLLNAAGVGFDPARSIAQAVANVAGSAWRYEGGALEQAGQAADEGDAPQPVLTALALALADLARAVDAAQEAVATAEKLVKAS